MFMVTSLHLKLGIYLRHEHASYPRQNGDSLQRVYFSIDLEPDQHHSVQCATNDDFPVNRTAYAEWLVLGPTCALAARPASL